MGINKGKSSSKKQLVIQDGDKVVADRFRTKMCKNYIDTGSCPYESRCMFAHGQAQMRTLEMNLRDGLVNEESIRHFKKLQGQAQRGVQLQQKSSPRCVPQCEPVAMKVLRFDSLYNIPSPSSFEGDEQGSIGSAQSEEYEMSDSEDVHKCHSARRVPSPGPHIVMLHNSYRYNPYGPRVISCS